MRAVTDKDFNDVYDIYMDEKNNPYLLYEASDKETFRPVFKELMNKDIFLACENNNQVIGICSCSYGVARTSHVAYIGTLAMKSEYHGQGYGTKFVNTIINNLKEKEFKRIDLWVEADNPNAQNFYKKLGFKEEARIEKYYKRANSDEYIDEIIMSKLFN